MLATLVIFAILPCVPALGDTAYHQGTDGNGTVRALWYDGSALSIFTSDDVYYTWADGLTEHPFFGAEIAEGDGEYVTVQRIVPGDDGLYLLLTDDDGSKCTGVHLCSVGFDGAGNAELGKSVALQWDEMIGASENASHCRDAVNPMVAGNYFVFIALDDSVARRLAVFDRNTGVGEFYDTDADGYQLNIRNVCAYGDGRALIGCAENGSVAVCEIDLSTGETEKRCEIPALDPSSLVALAYGAEADQLYYVLDGTLSRISGFDPETAEELAYDAPGDSLMDISCALLPDGRFALSDWDAVTVYDPNAEEAAVSLSIEDCAYVEAIDDAAVAFQEAHPNADVRVKKQGLLGARGVAQAILTQSQQYDIYVLFADDEDYAVLYDRGYLPALTGSAVLTRLVGAMYPEVQDAVEVDGALVALPVYDFMNMTTVNEDALLAIGLSEKDIPKTWPEYFALLARLPDLLKGTEYCAFAPTETPEDLRYSVFEDLLHSYLIYLENDESVGMAFNTDILRGALAAFEKVDFEALATDEGWEDGDFDEEKVLFTIGNDVSLSNSANQSIAMPLALADGMEPMADMMLTVAIVNPYSKNFDAALQFLESTTACLAPDIVASLTPGMDDAIKWPNSEDTVAFYKERIAETQKELQDAKSDQDKAKWSTILDALNQNYADFLENSYMVTAEQVAAYRAYADDARIWRFLGFHDYDEIGQELDAQINMYLDAKIGVDALLRNLDEKMNMMLREGAR